MSAFTDAMIDNLQSISMIDVQAFVWLVRAIEDREIGFLAALRRYREIG